MSKLLGWVLAVAACGPAFHLPMTAAQLEGSRDARALAMYLGQPGADPAVCDARAPGSHAAHDPRVGVVLVGALRAGTIQPDVWRTCVEHVLATAQPANADALIHAVMRAYPAMLGDAVEVDPAARERLRALAAVYQERAPERQVRREDMAALADALRARLPGLGAHGRASALELLATLDVERGQWGARVVDRAWLDALDDHALLARLAARLPDARLRTAAARRLVRLRIAASPYPEVRAEAARVEEVVLRTGVNAVATPLRPPVRATIDPARLALSGVQVDQQLDRQTAQLRDRNGQGARLLGPLPLQGALRVELTGLSAPITLCGGARALDPTPCVAAGDVVIDSPLVRRDPDGRLHFVEQITAAQVAALARQDRLVLPIAIAGVPLVELTAPLGFATRDALRSTSKRGGAGPALQVDVEARGDRLIFAVASAAGVRHAVVERARVGELAIISRGGEGTRGSDGSSGSNGSDGRDGSDASCPSSDGTSGTSGADGGDGSDGAHGGDGGPGGEIRVRVRCADAGCAALVPQLRAVIRSEGGDGGAGGQGGGGGRGGRGGSGGSSTSCTTTDGAHVSLHGGSPALSGTSGASGHDGSRGRPGAPGTVVITTAPAASRDPASAPLASRR